jgi:hypothetical protein
MMKPVVILTAVIGLYMGRDTLLHNLFYASNVYCFMTDAWPRLVRLLNLPPCWMFDTVLRLGGCLVAFLSVTCVSWLAYERPLNRLRHHFPYVRRCSSMGEAGQ